MIFSCPTEQSVQTISTYTWNPQAGKQLRIPISQLYRLRYDAPEKKGGLIFLKIRCSGGTPARITYGLNYSINDHIGTNISTSALISKFWNTTPRTWKWGPIVPSKGGRNHILVSCFKLHEAPGVNHDLIFSIHGQNGSVHKSYFSMCNFSSMTICAEDFIEHDGCLDILWYTITATESIFDINQLFVSAHGRIGGDHSF